jgi:hypothetical protein
LTETDKAGRKELLVLKRLLEQNRSMAFKKEGGVLLY